MQNKKSLWKKIWHFFWDDDSIWSWLANIAVAFIIIRFILYPLLGVLLGTNFPIVAVVSESMEHGPHNGVICGFTPLDFQHSFNSFWKYCGDWYEERNITEEQFKKFPFKNGFDKGDVIILWRANSENLHVGDILIFQGSRPQPIIHRIVKVWEENGKTYYQTKGDHNSNSITGIAGETQISEERIFGKGVVRIPYLGWLKIIFVEALKPLGITIQR